MKNRFLSLLLLFSLCLLGACAKAPAPGTTSAEAPASALQTSAFPLGTSALETDAPLPSFEDFFTLEGFSVVPVTGLSDGLTPAEIIYGAATSEENTLLLAANRGEAEEMQTFLYKINAETGNVAAKLVLDPSLSQRSTLSYNGQIFYAFPKPYGYLLTFSGGFLAVDYNLFPLRQVLFADLRGFDWLWIGDGENFIDRYDVTDDFRFLVTLGQTYSVIDLKEVRPLVWRGGMANWSIDLGGKYHSQPDLALAGDTVVGIGERRFSDERSVKSEQGLYTYSLAENKKTFTPLPELEDILSCQSFPVLDGGQSAEFCWEGASQFAPKADDRLIYRFSWPEMALTTAAPALPAEFPENSAKQLMFLQTKRFSFLSVEVDSKRAFICFDLETNTQRAVVYPGNTRFTPVCVSPDGAVLAQFSDYNGATGFSGLYILR